MGGEPAISRVAAAIQAYRYRYTHEDDLQEAIAAALESSGFRVEREVLLDARSRLDLLVDGTVAVEIKIAGGRADVRRQVERYLAHARVCDLILVSSRVRSLPTDIAVPEGKRLELLSLVKAGL